MIVKHRRGTTKEWQEDDLVPEEGELVIEECRDGTLKCKIGNGYTKFSKLPYIDDAAKATLLQKITEVKENIESQLLSLKTSIPAELTKDLAVINSDIAAESHERSVAIANLQQSISLVESTVTDMIRSTTDEVASELSAKLSSATESTNKGINDLQVKLDTRTAELTSVIENKANAFEASLTKVISDNDAKFAEVVANVEANNEVNTSKFNAINKQVATLNNNLEETVSTFSTELAQANARLTAADTTLEAALDAKIVTLVGELDAKLADQIAGIEATHTADAVNVRQDIRKVNAGLLELSAHVDNVLEKTDANIEDLWTNIDSVAEDFSSRLDEQASALEDLSAVVSTEVLRLDDQISSATANFDAKISEQAANFSSELTSLSEELNSQLLSDMRSLRGQVVELHNTHSTDLATLRTETTEHLSTINNQLGTLQTAYNELAKIEETLLDALTSKSLELQEDFIARDSAMAADFNIKLTRLTTTLRNERESDIGTLASKTAADISSVDAKLDNAVKEITSTVTDNAAFDAEERAKVKAELQQALSSAETRIDSNIDKAVNKLNSDLSTYVDNLIEETTEDISALEKRLDKSVEDITLVINDSISAAANERDNLRNDLLQDIKDSEDRVNSNITKANDELNSILSAHIDNVIGKTEAYIEELCDNVSSKVDETAAELAESIADQGEELNAQLSAVIAELNTEYQPQIASIRQDISTVVEDVENLGAHVDNSAEKIEASVEDLSLRVDEIVDELAEQSNNFDKKLSDTANEISSSLTAAYLQKIAETAQDLQGKISTAEANQSGAVANLRSYTGSAVATINTKLSNLNSLYKDLETAKTTLSSALATLEQQCEDSSTEVAAQITSALTSVAELTGQLRALEDRHDISENKLLDNIDNLVEAVDSVTTSVRVIEKYLTGDTSDPDSDIPIPPAFEQSLAKQLEELSASLNSRINALSQQISSLQTETNAINETVVELCDSKIIDGLRYEDNELWLTCKGEQVGNSVTITGGTGTGPSVGYSIVTIENNLPSELFTVANGKEVWANFTYTSFRNEVQTPGEGTCSVAINEKNIPDLYCRVQHGVPKPLELTKYLSSGKNVVEITCMDRYGTSETLALTIIVVELRLESTFNSAQIFESNITFKYKVFGQSEKTVYVLVDDNKIHEKTFTDTQTGNSSETTVTIPKQAHGCHKITAYVKAVASDGSDIAPDALVYDIICINEADINVRGQALLTSKCDAKEATQGDLVSISYMIYDYDTNPASVNLNVYSMSTGERVKIDEYCTSRVVDRNQQFWNIRNYPIGPVVFEVSYTYDYYGDIVTISKEHEVTITKVDLDVSPMTDSLQLYLHANGKSNDSENPAVWEYTRKFLDPDGKETEETITTTFENFNWKSNGWDPDKTGEPILRLNGDAKAVINFRPFENDFKTNGKTIEFDFAVRDVNDRKAVVIDCFEAEVDDITGEETGKGIGFRATPDTAFLKSSDTEVSCRYKDGERVRVAISVEAADTASKFVSIYLDGVLSGIQQYTTNTTFSQSRSPQKITLGSPYCGLDLYNIRIYDKALGSAEILNNYISDQASPTIKQQLIKDNDILDENGNISYKKVKDLGQIPIITFTGSMPTYKDDKKVVLMDFENPLDPARSFSKVYGGPIQVEIDVQGTSSQYYIRKNWKIKLERKAKDANGDTLKDADGKTVYEFKNAAYQHMADQIPAKVFCIKVDYAEATGTHNTGTANYVETFYDRKQVMLPPQKDDERVRTTIAGFPCIIFEKATETSEPVFSSKGNFNYDKGAEDTFGFTEDYDSYGVECWEFKNNTSDAVNFAGEIPAAWENDFEPRYVPETAKFDRIEKLLKQRSTAPLSEEEAEELATLQSACIPNFKEMHDWVVSTATFELEPVVNADGQVVDTVKVQLSADERKARLNKFKTEFTDYFNMHYSCIYYVYTFFALMTDQRAKNLFLTRWKDDDGVFRWYPYFYDNDTIFGINNEGALVFDYYHEDTDQVGSSNVYNGQNSVLWNNFRECFPDKIQEMYAKLRSDGKLTYDAVIDSYVTKGSDKWSAAIYNADAEYKYVTMAREHVDHTDEDGNKVTGLDASNLYQVRGPGEHHLRYFTANRLNYCDSKWDAGDYKSDFFFLRVYTPSTSIPLDTTLTEEELLSQYGDEQVRIYKSLKSVKASPNITITPFSDMYTGVKYGAGSTLIQKRMTAGNADTFKPLDATQKFNDTETAVYGASSVASLGDLSGLYCGVVNLVGKNTDDASAAQGNVKENKLVELIIGNSDENYHNDNFREIEVGTCRLLQKIDLRNCSGLGKRKGIAGEKVQTSLKLGGCPNIEEIYTEGTNLESVELPDGGYVKTLHLPASTNTLVIKNQKYISDFQIESYRNIRTLQIENSNLNTADILKNCRNADGKYTVVHVSLTDVQLGTKEQPVTVDFVKSLVAKYDSDSGALLSGIRGLGDDKQAYIRGTCYIKTLTGADYVEIKETYKELTILFDEMTDVFVNFEYLDEAGIKHVEPVPVEVKNSTPGSISEQQLATLDFKPVWSSNAAFDYTFVGWSEIEQSYRGTEDGVLISDYEKDEYLRAAFPDAFNGSSLVGIVGNRTLHPVFKATRRTYGVTFVNPTAPEGERVINEQPLQVPYGYTANYSDLGIAEPQKLDRADPSVYEVVGWYSTEGTTDSIKADITFEAQFAVADQDGPDYNNDGNSDDDGDGEPGYTIGWADIGQYYDSASKEYKDGYTLYNNNTMVISKCSNAYNSVLKIPDQLTVNDISYTVTSIGGVLYDGSFVGTDKLSLVYLPDTLVSLASRAFAGCNKLYEIEIPKNVESISDTAFQDCTGLTNITVADGNTHYRVENDCLIDNTNKLVLGLSTGSIPSSVTSLGNNCFYGMSITEIDIPEGITAIPSNAFSYCRALTSVTLPDLSLTSLGATCFGWCSKLATIILPETLTSISSYVFNGCALTSVEIPAKVGSVGDRAFGAMNSLTQVTFNRASSLPDIHYHAFDGSGPISQPEQLDFIPLTLKLPWTQAEHKKFVGKYKQIADSDTELDKDIFFGAAIGSTLEFSDGSKLVKENAVENGNRFGLYAQEVAENV